MIARVFILIHDGIGDTANNPRLGLHTCFHFNTRVPSYMSPLSYTWGGINGAANTLGALRHISTLKPKRVLAVLPIPLGLHMCCLFSCTGGPWWSC